MAMARGPSVLPTLREDDCAKTRGWLAVLDRTVSIGVPPGMAPHDAKYVKGTNAVSLIATLISIAYLPVFLSTTWDPFFVSVISLQIPIWALPLLLNRAGRHLAATQVLAFGSCFIFVGQILLIGPDYGHAYFLLLTTIGSFLLFPPRHARSVGAGGAPAGTAYLCIVAFGSRIEPLYPLDFGAVSTTATIHLGLFLSILGIGYWSRRNTLAAEAELEVEHEKTEALIRNILPDAVVARLKQSREPIADGFEDVTVLFADIAGFTPMSSRMTPAAVVEMLNGMFSAFDRITERHGLEKIKTIGDAYMVAGGLPEIHPDPAGAVAEMALEMVEAAATWKTPDGEPVRLRIGICTGPVVAGVIGVRKFIYDLWGDTVNTASRMESHGRPGAIQVTESTQRLLESRYAFEPRGEVEIKGKGVLRTWFLTGRASQPPHAQASGGDAAC
jgi:adenylate cyclase